MSAYTLEPLSYESDIVQRVGFVPYIPNKLTYLHFSYSAALTTIIDPAADEYVTLYRIGIALPDYTTVAHLYLADAAGNVAQTLYITNAADLVRSLFYEHDFRYPIVIDTNCTLRLALTAGSISAAVDLAYSTAYRT